MPLSTLAHAFALLATGMDAEGKPVPALAEIRDAMRAHPENVGGEGRLDTLVMRTLGGEIVCKVGAEGVHATGHPKRAIGIALKIMDGSRRALKLAVVGVLDQVGILSLEERGRLDPPEASVLRNHAGIEVGEVRSAVKLERETP
jgi:L-asparaginase II